MLITTVLFDMGNVLSDDGHDTYLTHAKYGLMRSSDMTDTQILAATAPTFRKYAVQTKTDQKNFWQDISRSLDVSLSSKDIKFAKQAARAINPEVEPVFSLLKQHGIAIGIISNSLSFLYDELAAALHLPDVVDPSLCFLSHETGKLKSNGLFELAATRLNPAQTMIIDDRLKNVAYAQKLGFYAKHYSFSSGDSLLKLVSQFIC